MVRHCATRLCLLGCGACCARKALNNPFLFGRGIARYLPLDWEPGRCMECAWQFHPDLGAEDRQPVFRRELGSVFLDGSCLLGSNFKYARAVWAVVQMTPDGHRATSFQGLVPRGGAQTAVVAEHLSWFMVVDNSVGPITFVADCQAVVNASAVDPRVAGRADKVQGGYWREVRRLKLLEVLSVTAKVKTQRCAPAGVGSTGWPQRPSRASLVSWKRGSRSVSQRSSGMGQSGRLPCQ